MAASDPTMAVPTPTGALQGVAAASWDGSAWQPAGRTGPSVATPTGVLQGVAPFSWDGSAWQPTGRAGPAVATPTGVLDGVAVYTWSGSAWTPPGGQPTPSTPGGALRGVAAFFWDGTSWQPVGQAGPSIATPTGVLAGVAMFSWTGSAWAPAQGTGPSLDLNFMNPGTLPSGVTFTRTSGPATYFDVTGAMQTIASSTTPRWDYDPVTHVLKGMLIETSRTNILLNSATLGTQSVTVTATPYVLSFYGTGTITLSGVSTAGPLVGTGAFPTRVLLAFTPTAGTLTLTVTGTVQSAQLEAGAYATSYIPTFGVVQGRGNEITTALTGAWYTQGVGSLSTECIINGANGFPRIAEFNDGTTANEIMHYMGASTGLLLSGSTLSGAGGWSMGNAGTYVANAVIKMASSWQAGAQLFNLNGIQPKSAAAAGVPLGITQLLLGHDNTGATTEVIWLRRYRYWPRALSAAELQAVTT